MTRLRTNPVYRLHSFLEEGRKMRSAPSLGGGSVRYVLSELFRTDPLNEAEVLNGLAKFYRMVERAEKCISLLDAELADDYKLCLEPVVSKLVNLQMEMSWDGTLQLTKAAIAHIRITAEALNSVIPEVEVEEQELDELARQVRDLQKSVGEADINVRFKASILKALAAVLDSIDDYRWFGADGLKESAANAFGLMVVNRADFLAANEQPWVKKYWETIGRVADAAAVAMLAHEIGIGMSELAAKLLGE